MGFPTFRATRTTTTSAEISHMREAIATAVIRDFAVPHIVADNIFPERLIEQINEHWPRSEIFVREIAGNHIFHMRRRNAWRLTGSQRKFWKIFNETLWPAVVAAVAEKFSGPGLELFGELYRTRLRFAQPMTLMRADPTYLGHGMHTHFYHCPHWTFTMLFYCDPEDRYSKGTALHRLLPRQGHEANGDVTTGHRESSYLADDLDWRAELAMDTFRWDGPTHPDALYERRIVDYRCNSLLAFMDGPFAFHSVPIDGSANEPDPRLATEGGRYARRRIVRSHLKIQESAFYTKHSSRLPSRLSLPRFARILAPPTRPALSTEDGKYREAVIRPFFKERLEAYARAASSSR